MDSDAENIVEQLTAEEIQRRIKTLPVLKKPAFAGVRYTYPNGKQKQTQAFRKQESQWERDVAAHRRREYIKLYGENGAPLTLGMKRTKSLREDAELRKHINEVNKNNKRKYRQDPVKREKLKVTNRAYYTRPDIKKRANERRNLRGRSSEKFQPPKKCTKCTSIFLWKSNLKSHMELFHGPIKSIRDSLRCRYNPFSRKNTNIDIISPLNSQEDQELAKEIAEERKESIALYSLFLNKLQYKAYVYIVIFIESDLIIGKNEEEILSFLQLNNNNNLRLTFYVGKGRRKGIAAYHYTCPKISSIVAEKAKEKRAFLVQLYEFATPEKAANLADAEKLECLIQLYAIDSELRVKPPKHAPHMHMINRHMEVTNMIKFLSENDMEKAMDLATYGRQLLCLNPNCEASHDNSDELWSARLHLKSSEISEILGFNEGERTFEDDEDDEEDYY